MELTFKNTKEEEKNGKGGWEKEKRASARARERASEREKMKGQENSVVQYNMEYW